MRLLTVLMLVSCLVSLSLAKGRCGFSCFRSAGTSRRRGASVLCQERRQQQQQQRKQQHQDQDHALYSLPVIGRGSTGLTELRDLQQGSGHEPGLIRQYHLVKL